MRESACSSKAGLLGKAVGFWLIAVYLATPSAASASSLASILLNLRNDAAKPKTSNSRPVKPIWYKNSESGQTFLQAFHEVCGDQGKAEAGLLNTLKRLNSISDVEDQIPLGSDVAVPFCVRLKQNVKVTVRKGDTLEGILLEEYGQAGPLTLGKVVSLNDHLQSADSTLYENSTITIPYAVDRAAFENANERTANGTIERPSFETASCDPTRASECVAPQAGQDSRSYQYIEFMTLDDAKKFPNCVSDPTQVPFSSKSIIDRIEAEQAAGATITDTTVGIIDTGISSAAIPENFLAINTGEARFGDDHLDNDHNTYIDDIFGINMNPGNDNGRIEYFAHDRERSHGTIVTSLVLGGNDFIAAAVPYIHVSTVNYSSAERGRGTVAPEFMGQAIDYLKKRGAAVINMSLASKAIVSGTLLAIQTDPVEVPSHALVVAAAGNESSGGQPLSILASFPGRYGGRAGRVRDRVVTVGASNLTGDIAGFSHYSSEFVDLLAPGCSIQVRDIDGSPKGEYGTSVSTAMVSFVAALIHGLGISDPVAIKNRLLAGTDPDPRLQDRAWSSGRLDAEKSISLRFDVIDPLDDSQPMIYGHLSNPHSLSTFCAEKSLRPQLDQIRKVIPNLGPVASPSIEYWVEIDGTLSKVRCSQRQSGDSIGSLVVRGAAPVAGPPLREVRDIVPALILIEG